MIPSCVKKKDFFFGKVWPVVNDTFLCLFSKVLYTVTLHSKYTRALIFQIFEFRTSTVTTSSSRVKRRGRRHARRQVGRKLFTYYYVNNFLPKKKRNYLRITTLRITNLHRKVSFTLGGSAWGQRFEGNWYLHRKLLFKQECIIYLGRKRVRTQVGRILLFTYY